MLAGIWLCLQVPFATHYLMSRGGQRRRSIHQFRERDAKIRRRENNNTRYAVIPEHSSICAILIVQLQLAQTTVYFTAG